MLIRRFPSLLLAGLLLGCAHEPPAKQAEPVEPKRSEAVSASHAPGPLVLTPEVQRAIGLKTARAERRAVPARQEVLGQVEARPESEAVVHAPLTGRITRLHAQVGERVAQGAPLATLESAELGAAQAGYLKALGAARLAEREHTRVRRLFDAELASIRERDEAAARAEAARVAQAEAVEQLRVLGYTDTAIARLARRARVELTHTVTAPASGTVMAREAALGDRARPDAETPMFRLVDLSVVRIEADLPERDFLAIKSGQPAEVALEALGGRTVSGRVAGLAPQIDPESRTGKALIDVPNAKGLLRPGMSCRVRIETGRRDALVIPEAAVQREADRAFVYVPEPEGRFREAAVTLGARRGEAYEVLSGLAPGTVVVTKGSFDLRAQARKAQFGGD